MTLLACGNPAHPAELITLWGAIAACGGIGGVIAIVRARYGL